MADLSVVPMSEPDEPTTRDLLDAWEAPGPLEDQPSVRALRRQREHERLETAVLRLEAQAAARRGRPTLTLIKGGA
jgi:hypothetical protein